MATVQGDVQVWFDRMKYERKFEGVLSLPNNLLDGLHYSMVLSSAKTGTTAKKLAFLDQISGSRCASNALAATLGAR